MAALAAPANARHAVERLVELFRSAAQHNAMCLCGALGASSAGLPEPVRQSAVRFSQGLVEWLEQVPGGVENLPMPPESIVALLEGALLLSVTARNPEFFSRAIRPILEPAQ